MIANISNEYFKKLRKLNNKKYRPVEAVSASPLFTAESTDGFDILLEGERLITQTLDFGVKIKSLYIRADKIAQYGALISKADSSVFGLSRQQSEMLSETRNEQGVFARLKFQIRNPEFEIQDFRIYLNNISDPGNLGTILRTASAFDIGGLILDNGCCDLSNSKIIRASLGAIFNVPLQRVDESWLAIQNVKILISDVQNGLPIDEISFLEVPYIVVIGSEAHGVSEYISRLPHKKIKIPMIGEMQSLNVSVATGILMYELSRRRG